MMLLLLLWMCRRQEEPTYNEVTSRPGPVPRPRINSQTKPEPNNAAIYAPIVHNKK